MCRQLDSLDRFKALESFVNPKQPRISQEILSIDLFKFKTTVLPGFLVGSPKRLFYSYN